MKFKSPLIAVTDMERSKSFYKNVLGLRVIMDFGANVTLTGGIALQTYDSWAGLLGRKPDELGWCGKVSELYFEEDDLDTFLKKLETMDIHYLHPLKEQSWGQRAVRFYDPDCHIIEVGESLKSVCLRFIQSGMTPEQVARRMDVPQKLINSFCRKTSLTK